MLNALELADFDFKRPPAPKGLPMNRNDPLHALQKLEELPKAGDTRLFSALPQAAFLGCPPGSFRMGSDDTDEEALHDEKPSRDVTLTRGFWMQQTPVTQEQWQALAGFNPSFFKNAGPKAPVEHVSWFDAVWFCNLLSKKEGLPEAYRLSNLTASPGSKDFSIGEVESLPDSPGYRLPTEAQWEYACRAGTTTPRYGEIDEIAWWGAYEGEGNARVTYQEAWKNNDGISWGTLPVGQKRPNPWGFYDILGNVSEWCFDAYLDSYEGLPSSDPQRTSGGMQRVKRGSGWTYYARSVRAAYRSGGEPTERLGGLGLRLLRYA